MASEQLKRYLSKYDYEDSIENLTIGYMFGISPDEARGIDYCDLSDEDSTYYDDVYKAIEKELYENYHISDNRKRMESNMKITESTGPQPTDEAKKMMKDAKVVGLEKYFDDYMLNFCFNSPEELKQNANKIRRWMKLYPDYFICKEPADAYDEDSADGYLYFVSDMDEVPKEERMNIDSFENGFYESINNNRKRNVNEAIANWKIKLMSGKNLHRAIDSEDIVDILTALEDCWREIHEKMPDDYDENDLENDLDEIENQLDNAENYDDYDMTEEDVREEVDYLLDQFYDFCDNVRIWVELD